MTICADFIGGETETDTTRSKIAEAAAHISAILANLEKETGMTVTSVKYLSIHGRKQIGTVRLSVGIIEEGCSL